MNLVDQSNYGSDNVGLINGFCFAPDRPGVAIESADAVEWLERGGDGGLLMAVERY